LPQLVDDNVKRLIIIDSGDVLVLRDLSEMYNWNMSNNIYMGAPDQSAGIFGKISNKTLNFYINTGHYLIDVKKVKDNNMYQSFLKYKGVYDQKFPEQHMINDIAFGKIGYLPLEFGLVQPFSNDESFYNRKKITIYNSLKSKLNMISNNSLFLPKTYEEILHLAFNPVIVHSWNGKWSEGKGINIYRKLCQYFIRLTGIEEEICKNHPGYCKKI